MTMLQDIFARPVAHRGYHDASSGRMENSPTAITAAMEKGFGIEVDVQETADGEALVFHDYTLDRLTDASGKVIEQTSAALTQLKMKTGGDPLWLLQDLFDLVDGKVPLVIEIKSFMRPGAQGNFVRRVVDQVSAYKGAVCIKSFDPDMVEVAKMHNPDVLRGIVADAARADGEFSRLSFTHRFILRHLVHYPRTSPNFISYGIKDLPQFGPSLLSRIAKLPIMTWTVRTDEDRQKADRFADQIVFEGFDPDAS